MSSSPCEATNNKTIGSLYLAPAGYQVLYTQRPLKQQCCPNFQEKESPELIISPSSLPSGLALLNFYRLYQYLPGTHTAGRGSLVPASLVQWACGTESLSLAGALFSISGDQGGLQVLSASDSLPPPTWLQAGAVEVGEGAEEGAMSPYIPVRLKN